MGTDEAAHAAQPSSTKLCADPGSQQGNSVNTCTSPDTPTSFVLPTVNYEFSAL